VRKLLRNAHCGVKVCVRARFASWVRELFLNVCVSRRVGSRLIASLSLALGLVAGAEAAGASFVYDELGRLIQVIAADGTSTQYTYDAAGNILAVRADTTSTLAITSFFPESGSIGSTVTLTGSGFSTTAANNAVTFNGTTASVTAATATRLTVTVPSGASTGAIGVSNANGSVSSSRVFTVGLGSTPTITSFSPNIGNPGTAVTITGQNFQATPSDNHLFFNTLARATISSTTPTSLSTSVPSAGASGKLSVSTIYGSVTSSADFLAVPPSLNPANVLAWSRASIGGAAQTLNISVPQDSGAVIFDGASNQPAFVDATGSVISPAGSSVTYEAFGPQGTRLATGTISATQLIAELPPLTASGTYSIFFEPGAATANLKVALKADAAVTVDGPSVSVGAGQRLSFLGAMGQNLGLGLTGLTFSGGASGYIDLIVYKPNGMQWQSVRCNTGDPGSSCNLVLSNLPSTGVYTVVELNQGSPAITGGMLTLSSDKTGTLTAGTALPLSLRNGQNGRLTFAGTAGQPATIRWKSITTTPANLNVAVTIFKPDGTVLSGPGYGSASTDGTVMYVPSLPSTGTYSVVATPAYGALATLSMTLNPASELAIDGTPVSITSSASGNGTSVIFNATAGQNLGLGLSGLAFSGGTSGSVNLLVFRPDATQWQATTCSVSDPGGSCNLVLSNVPLTGTYIVFVTNSGNPAITGGTLTLSSDRTGTLTPGAASSLSLRNGQNGRLTFAGTAGQPATIRWKSITTTPANLNVAVTIFKPDGTVLSGPGYGSASTDGTVMYVPSLPSTGTYSVVATPAYGALATLSMTLNPASELAIDGTPVSITSSASGNGTSVIFNATAGQNLGLGLSGLAFSGGTSGSVNLLVFRPDATQWQATTCSVSDPGGSCNLVLSNVPLTGTYIVFVTNSGNPAITGGTLTLSSDKTGTLTPGTASSLSLRSGQSGRLTFAGTAGQPAAVRFEGITTLPANVNVAVTILRPDGTVLSGPVNGLTSLNGNAVYVASLPSTGSYVVLVTPAYGAVTTLSITLNPASELVIDGASVNVTSPATAYGTSVSFNAVAGQNLGLGVTGLAFNGGVSGIAFLSISKPDGTQLQWQDCQANNPGDGCNMVLSNLPVTGTYMLFVANFRGAPAITAGTLTLSSDKTGTLTLGTTSSLILRNGQNGRLTFAGTAASHTLVVGTPATTPAGQAVSITVLNSTGGTVSTGSYSTAGGTLTLGTLTADNYTVLVTTAYGAATNVALTYQ